MGLIKDLYIIYHGVVIFSRTSGNAMNEQIFGAYITAIDQFSSELTEKGVQEFELQNLKYVLTRHGKLLFVASAPTKIKAKKILKELKIIESQFLEDYPIDFLGAWDGNVDIFKEFHKQLDKSFKGVVKNFEKSVW